MYSVIALSGLAALIGAPTFTVDADGNGAAIFTAMNTYLTSSILPAFVGLALLVIGVLLAIRWARRATSGGGR